jgi:uncharacterized protein
MNSIENILQQDQHRPYPIPDQNWKYYQEWHNVIFAHWRVPASELRILVPTTLELDQYDGTTWISMVAFTIKDLRPHYLPAFPPVSNFHEINMRTYVKRNGKPGIYFLSVEASKIGSVLLARTATGLHYIKSEIIRNEHIYKSHNNKHLYNLELIYEPLPADYKKDQLDRWLTERYCIFHELQGALFAHDVHHVEWPLQAVNIHSFNADYSFKNLSVNSIPASRYHFSKGVNVLTWAKHKA